MKVHLELGAPESPPMPVHTRPRRILEAFGSFPPLPPIPPLPAALQRLQQWSQSLLRGACHFWGRSSLHHLVAVALWWAYLACSCYWRQRHSCDFFFLSGRTSLNSKFYISLDSRQGKDTRGKAKTDHYKAHPLVREARQGIRRQESCFFSHHDFDHRSIKMPSL